MKIKALKRVVERRPFRPFTVRLTNGARYRFQEPRDVGAPRDCHTLVYFGPTELVLIDPENIVEILPRANR
ncbi:MAG: hypothetical protein C5B50_25220 [Verrucomicrobia bacterium]|nr:MAG: hypothetical protein C5B50_25220 [Verrucomicrobiota bacterium]